MIRLLARLLVPLVLVAAFVVEARLPAAAPPPAPAPPAALAAGSATCAALGTGEDAGTTALVLAGERPAALDEAATARLRVRDGERLVEVLTPSTDGTVGALGVPQGLAAPVLALRWRTTPVVLARTWSVAGDDLAPGTYLSGPCPTTAEDAWVVPGLATAEGASARLHLANPTRGTATAQVRLTTPGGPVEPARLRNVVVAAGEQLVLDLGEFAPEEPDLGVLVELEAGRLVVEAVQELEPAIGGIAGATLVAATPAPASSWTVPWIDGGPTTSTWMWVTNPGEAIADVRLVAHTADGATVPRAAALVLAPGSTERVDLSRLTAADGAGAVTVTTAEDAPVAVDAMVVVGDDQARRSGVTSVAAAEPVDGPLVVLADGSGGRSHTLHLTNPAEQPTTVDVEVRDEQGVVEGAGAAGVVVPAGATLPLGLPDVPGAPFGVVATPRGGAVVAALVSRSGGGDLELVATTAVPFPSLQGGTGARIQADATLLQRTGTPLQP